MSDQRHSTPLQPCPFCGGEAAPGKSTITRDRDSEGNKGTFTGYFVSCIYCSADNQGIAEGWKTPELAAEKWNRRATVVPSESGERLLPGQNIGNPGTLPPSAYTDKKDDAWRSAALRLGEQLAPTGPNWYYAMTPTQWLEWCRSALPSAELPRSTNDELPGMLAVAKGVAEQRWPHTMDAKIWADEFVKLNPGADHGLMLGWFANAIMAGYDTAQARVAQSATARSDTERLNWLDYPGRWLTTHADDSTSSFHCQRKQAHFYIAGKYTITEGVTAREAIDAAMRATDSRSAK